MYYAPTYGYYYYGWKWKNSNGTCKTNSMPLHEKSTITVNNSNSSNYPNDNGVGVCTPGTAGCIHINQTINPSNTVVGCSQIYSYYNRDRNQCYATYQDFLNSYHIDSNYSGSNVSVDYYSPYQLKFRESVYPMAFNVVSPSGDLTPSAPIVEGPHDVTVGTSNTYFAYTNSANSSTTPVAKTKKESLLASAIFAIKKAFAQTASDNLRYLFDWNSDGVVDYSTVYIPYYPYGPKASSNYTWSEATTTHIMVAAQDLNSGKISSWTSFDISATVPPVTAILAPVISGGYCTDSNGVKRGTISWVAVDNADGYNINVGSFNTGNTQPNVTQFQISNFDPSRSSPYTVYSYRLSTAEAQASNPLLPSQFTNNGSCSQNPYSGNTIQSGFKFYSNPSWASSSDEKCNFYGYASTTVRDGSGTIYNNVAINSCYVDKGIMVMVGSPPTSITRLGVGKHTLYCDLTYDAGISANGKKLTANLSVSTDGKCSKVPKVIEK